jgi:hypothetical protein
MFEKIAEGGLVGLPFFPGLVARAGSATLVVPAFDGFGGRVGGDFCPFEPLAMMVRDRCPRVAGSSLTTNLRSSLRLFFGLPPGPEGQ